MPEQIVNWDLLPHEGVEGRCANCGLIAPYSLAADATIAGSIRRQVLV